ncbi:MAG: TlpA family protein disulfide reductase [Sandaracinaceae bacterium]
MRHVLLLTSAMALAGAYGCDGGGNMPMPDAGGGGVDAGEVTGECEVPTGGFGTSAGRSNLLPFTLQRCDGSMFEFYGEPEGYCDARFTVVVMSAGWCGPCRMEATAMQAALVEAYGAQGVRVVSVLTQNNSYQAPDLDFCQGWKDQYGLTNDVMIDPSQMTQIYFPGNALPANLIVDSHGVIRHREYGFSEALGTIRSELDRLLAE